jgi:hypothetical protein
MAIGSFDLKAWALLGAQQRLSELDQERAAILSAFPQLRGVTTAGGRRPGRPPGSGAAKAHATGARKRKRRRMSADARRRISEAQKKRWAKQKATK